MWVLLISIATVEVAGIYGDLSNSILLNSWHYSSAGVRKLYIECEFKIIRMLQSCTFLFIYFFKIIDCNM